MGGKVPAWLGRNRAVRLVGELVRRYHFHDVGQQSAAMAYYLLFTTFPLLIFISSLLGVLDLDVDYVVNVLSAVLPRAVLDLGETYLQYVSTTASATILGFSLVFSIYFPMRAANCLVRCVRRAYGVKRPGNLVRYYLRVLFFTLILILVVLLSLLLITFGQRLLGYLAGHLAWMDGAIRIWNYLRFALLALILFATLGILYALAQDERQRAGALLPGALCALAGWMALSVGFSYFVETFGDCSLIYGALGAVVVLMIWLYLSAATLIMGAEVNGVFCSRRGERRERPEAEGDQPPEQKEKEI